MIKNLRFVAFMFFAFLLGCSVVNVGGNAEDYFPMEAGNTWVYEVKTGTKVISIYCDKSNIPFAKTAMKRATGKLPITGHIKVINNPKQ